MSPELMIARAAAYDAAADHVERGSWTDSEDERQQGREVGLLMRRLADAIRQQAGKCHGPTGVV